MYIQFYSIISTNKIANLDIDFELNHRLQGLSNRKNAKVNRNPLSVI